MTLYPLIPAQIHSRLNQFCCLDYLLTPSLTEAKDIDADTGSRTFRTDASVSAFKISAAHCACLSHF